MLLFAGIDRHSKNICKRLVGAESRLSRKGQPVDDFQMTEMVHLTLNESEREALKPKTLARDHSKPEADETKVSEEPKTDSQCADEEMPQADSNFSRPLTVHVQVQDVDQPQPVKQPIKDSEFKESSPV